MKIVGVNELNEFDYTNQIIITDHKFERTVHPSEWITKKIKRTPVIRLIMARGGVVNNILIKDTTLNDIVTKTTPFIVKTFRDKEIIVNPRYIVAAEEFAMIELKFRNTGNLKYEENAIYTDRYLVDHTQKITLSMED